MHVRKPFDVERPLVSGGHNMPASLEVRCGAAGEGHRCPKGEAKSQEIEDEQTQRRGPGVGDDVYRFYRADCSISS